jgi:hypothetical protein
MKNWKKPKWNASRKLERGLSARREDPTPRQTANASMDMLKEMRRISRKFMINLRRNRDLSWIIAQTLLPGFRPSRF